MDRDALVMIFSGINRLHQQADAKRRAAEQRLGSARREVAAAEEAVLRAREAASVVEAEIEEMRVGAGRVEEHRRTLSTHLLSIGIDPETIQDAVARVERAASSALPRPEARDALAEPARPPRQEPFLQSVHPTAADEEDERRAPQRRAEPTLAQARDGEDVYGEAALEAPREEQARRPAPFVPRAPVRVEVIGRDVVDADPFADPREREAPALGAAHVDGGDPYDRAPPVEPPRPVFASGARDIPAGFDAGIPATRRFGGGLGDDEVPLTTGRPLVRHGR